MTYPAETIKEFHFRSTIQNNFDQGFFVTISGSGSEVKSPDAHVLELYFGNEVLDGLLDRADQSPEASGVDANLPTFWCSHLACLSWAQWTRPLYSWPSVAARPFL